MTRPWGRSYDWVLRFLIQRDGEKCYICKAKVCKKHGHSKLIVEHKDNDSSNWQPENLGLAHRCCNGIKNPKGVLPRHALPSKKRERMSRPHGSAQAEWSSEEGRRSDKMTYRYRQRLFHPRTGMFRNVGQIYPKEWLAKMLPDDLGIGKSVTYRRYIEEDTAAGYFEEKEIDGETKIERTSRRYPLERLGIKESKKSGVKPSVISDISMHPTEAADA